MADLSKSSVGSSMPRMPRRTFMKLASLVGSGIAAQHLLDCFSPFADGAENAAAKGDDAGAVPKATDLYVAMNGDDNAAGTQAAPFQTLTKAQSALRTLRPIDKSITVQSAIARHITGRARGSMSKMALSEDTSSNSTMCSIKFAKPAITGHLIPGVEIAGGTE